MCCPPSEDRRQAVRAKRVLSHQYRIVKSRVKDFDRQWHLSTTHDMSLLGIAFLSDIPLQIGDIIEFQVVMSGILDICKGFGEVVRVEKKTTGAFYMVAIRYVEPPVKGRIKKTAQQKSRKSPSSKRRVPRQNKRRLSR